MDILDLVYNVDGKDVTSILTPVFVGLPLLYWAVRADRPHKTASILLIWFLHVPIYLFSLWSAKPVEFAREITLTILLNGILTILVVVTILLSVSFLIWGAWRLSYVSLPKSRRKWMARPPSFRDLKVKIDAALSHAFFHMIAHPKVRRLLRDPNLRTHSTKDIGWLLRDKETYSKAPSVIDKTKRFRELFDSLPPPRLPFHLSLRMSGFRRLPQNVPWMNLSFLLIPGLFTQSYPGYMSALRRDLQSLGLHVFYDLNDKENGSDFDTDKSTEHNARALRDEVLRLAGTSSERKIVAIGHSKGAVDFAAALSMYPDIHKHVACHISVQGPHGGTPIVNDLMNTYVQKDLALAGLHYILGANHEALIDMTYAKRRSFNKKYPYPYDKIKTVCLATHDERIFLGSLSMGQGPILLKPTIEYVKLRYEKECDGCICSDDAVLPGTMKVELSDMDHFGPAYRSFPASDPYDPARLCLSLTALALE